MRCGCFFALAGMRWPRIVGADAASCGCAFGLGGSCGPETASGFAGSFGLRGDCAPAPALAPAPAPVPAPAPTPALDPDPGAAAGRGTAAGLGLIGGAFIGLGCCCCLPTGVAGFGIGWLPWIGDIERVDAVCGTRVGNGVVVGGEFECAVGSGGVVQLLVAVVVAGLLGPVAFGLRVERTGASVPAAVVVCGDFVACGDDVDDDDGDGEVLAAAAPVIRGGS
jgi:hypothetical protein